LFSQGAKSLLGPCIEEFEPLLKIKRNDDRGQIGKPCVFASRIGIGNATQAEGWELQAIASSVIGGTSLFGAVGSVHGPLLGSFILTTINNGANLLNVNAFWQRIITGVLIIVIVYFDGLRAKKR
jgi:ribose transport system permease protein